MSQELDLDALEALAEKATPREWFAGHGTLVLFAGGHVADCSRTQDADFIVALVNAFPSLLAEAKAGRRNAEWRKALACSLRVLAYGDGSPPEIRAAQIAEAKELLALDLKALAGEASTHE